MDLCGLFEFKKTYFNDDIFGTFNNVSMFYHRYGVGDTVTLWNINGQFVHEDHKGGRINFKDIYDCESLTRSFQKPPSIELNEAIFLFHSDDNSGHTFSNLIKALYIYSEYKLECQIVIPEHILRISPFIKNVVDFFVPPEKLVLISPDDIVHCQLAYIYAGSWFFKYEYKPAISDNYSAAGRFSLSDIQESHFSLCPEVAYLKSKLIEDRNARKFHSTVSKISLLKTHDSIASTTRNRAFSRDYRTIVENNSFESIMPENFGISDLFDKIYSARKIVTSWGAISFINKVFIHPDADVLFLCHAGYHDEYSRNSWQIRNCYVPICHKAEYLFGLETDLRDSDKELIESNINHL